MEQISSVLVEAGSYVMHRVTFDLLLFRERYASIEQLGRRVFEIPGFSQSQEGESGKNSSRQALGLWLKH